MRRIASGGMAEVWMGRRCAMGGASKTVAIKLLAARLVRSPVYRRMFVDEARLTMMLTHSNIVQVFDVGEDAGRSYLVMEWVDGLDLSRLGQSMRERGEVFELHVIAHVIGELLRALAYAHGLAEGEASRTIVHRDISPHNVLISVSGEVKLSDFGVARLASEETSGLHVRGKLRYMPPEQIRGESRHPTIDLFAVGAVLQELLDGVRFRGGGDRDALYGMVLEGRVPPLRRAGVPVELRALRDALLARDPSDRVQSAEQALRLLRRWPGYRNAADELAALVRGRAGIEAPRTGLTVACSDEVLEPTDEPTVCEGSAALESSQLATRTVGRAVGRTGERESTPEVATAPHLEISSHPVGRGRRRLPAMLGVAAACLGVSLGFGWAWPHEPAASVAPAEPMVAVAAPPITPPRESITSADPTTLEAETEPEPEPEPEPDEQPPAAEREPESVARASRSRPRGEATTPARVEFAAHEFFFVWIKVGGTVHALEPVAEVSLPPGRHKVWLRQRGDQPWVAAGRIRVEAGGSYRVSMLDPAGLRQTSLTSGG